MGKICFSFNILFFYMLDLANTKFSINVIIDLFTKVLSY